MKGIVLALAICAGLGALGGTAAAQTYETRERVIVRDHDRGWDRGWDRRRHWDRDRPYGYERRGRVCRTILVRRYGEVRRIRECRR